MSRAIQASGLSALLLLIALPVLADVPTGSTEQPPPRPDEIEIVGDYAGRTLEIKANGKLLFDGSRPLEPTGISWRLGLGDVTFPVTVSFEFSDCTDPVRHEVATEDMPAFLIVRGCDVEHAK